MIVPWRNPSLAARETASVICFCSLSVYKYRNAETRGRLKECMTGPQVLMPQELIMTIGLYIMKCQQNTFSITVYRSMFKNTIV